MVKTRILIEGAVQGVGFRALVKTYAIQLALKGLVRNLPDGRVEIFCEGLGELVNQFVKGLDIKNEKESLLDLNIRRITVYHEGDENYKPAWKTYEGFEIDYGDLKMTPFEKETLESSELAKVQFWAMKNEFSGLKTEVRDMKNEMTFQFTGLKGEVLGLRGDVSGLRGEVSGLRGDVSGLRGEVSGVKTEVSLLRSDTNNNFNLMAEKYGSISKELVDTREMISKELKETKEGLEKSLDELPENITRAFIKGFKEHEK